MCSLSLYKRNHPDRLRKHILKFQFGVSRSEALQLIFGHLPYIELRKCMMVSKVWRKLALDELDVRYSVIISTEDQANVVLQKLRTTSQSFRVGSVSSSGLSLESLPLQILLGKVQNTLNLLKVDTPVGVTESLLHQVLANLPNLTHFSMTFIGASGSKKLNDKNDCVNFPLLGTQFSLSTSEKKLNKEVGGLGNYHSSDAINMCNQQQPTLVQRNLFAHQNIRYLQLDLGQKATFQLSKIFQAFPNLIELAIANILDEPRRHFRSLPQEASSSQSYQQHHEHPGQKLKRLSLRQYSNLGFSEKLLQTLMRLNMHLEKLELIFHPPSLSSTSSQVLKTLPVSSLLRQFIESQAVTLRCLKLAQVEDDLCQHSQNSNNFASSGNTVGSSLASNYYWNFNYSAPSASVSLLPLSLSRLEELHVQKPLITNLAQILNHFPKLTALSLQLSHGSNWQGFLPSRLEPHEHITRLKIDFIDADTFSKLGYCFPSLQTLQLAFCDLTLFKVLCELMPYFSGYGRGNRGNLVSCQQCHGTSQEFIVPKKNRNDAKSFSGGAGGPGTFHNGNVGSHASANNATFAFCKKSNNDDDDDHESTGTLKTSSQVPFDRLNLEYVMQHTRKKYPFKNLSLLRLRPCHHSPFENFVFLQRDRQGPIKQDLDLHYPNASFDNENLLFESDSSVGFSYDSTSVMKQEKFVELSAHPFDEDHELCSTA